MTAVEEVNSYKPEVQENRKNIPEISRMMNQLGHFSILARLPDLAS